MERALYLRPDNVRGTSFDDVVKDWLRKKEFEPVDDGDFNSVVFVPYDEGGNYYHAEVSPKMSLTITAAIADGKDINGIKIRDTDTDRQHDRSAGVTRCREILVECELEWMDGHYGRNMTLAIMTPDEVRAREETIGRSGELDWHKIGHDWRERA